ncbi:MAG: hypothetical protein AB7W37_06635 [Syntrophobacteraceae bacterium]
MSVFESSSGHEWESSPGHDLEDRAGVSSSAMEMYDYLPDAVPDYSGETLDVSPTGEMTEAGKFNQVVHLSDGGGRKIVTLDSAPIFTVTIQWEGLTADDAGRIFDFYFHPAKAFGMARSFRWAHPSDGHVYVVRFATELSRKLSGAPRHEIGELELSVIGRIADA